MDEHLLAQWRRQWMNSFVNYLSADFLKKKMCQILDHLTALRSLRCLFSLSSHSTDLLVLTSLHPIAPAFPHRGRRLHRCPSGSPENLNTNRRCLPLSLLFLINLLCSCIAHLMICLCSLFLSIQFVFLKNCGRKRSCSLAVASMFVFPSGAPGWVLRIHLPAGGGGTSPCSSGC